MPNWCEGNIKIRGKKKDVISFLENEILRVKLTKVPEKPKTENIKMKFNGFSYVYELENNKDVLYLKDSTRCFIEQSIIEIYLYSDTNKSPSYVTLNIKQAWGIEENLFEKLSDKYNLDFNIYASEKGMEFEQYITIIDGEITKNETKKYDDFYFEAINPELGG
mgnify:CR=1 FL=1|jgi:hypothetical protein|nr:MAG TPA: Ferredoxin-like domain in Api92-like protein [Caudoviricetes sp.]